MASRKSVLFSQVVAVLTVFCLPPPGHAHDENDASALIEDGKSHLLKSYQMLQDYQRDQMQAGALKENACSAKYGAEAFPAAKSDSKTAVHDSSGARERAIESDTALRRSREAYVSEARAAYDLFARAAKVAPAEPQPVFWEAAALLQMESYCRTLSAVADARKFGYDDQHKSLLFIHARALTKNANATQTDLQEGVRELKEFVRFIEGRSDLDYQLPSALKELDDASKALSAAKAKQNPPAWVKSYPNLKALACDVIPAHTELPFNAGIQTGIGYNDNVISLGRHQPLPPTSPRRGDVFNHSVFSLTRDIGFQHPYDATDISANTDDPKASPPHLALNDTFSLNYILTADTYGTLSTRNSLVNTAALSYKHVSDPHWFEFIKATDQFSYLDEVFSSNRVTLQGGVNFAETNTLSSQISYFFNRIDGFTPTTILTDPDGYLHRLEFVQTAILDVDPVDLTPALTATLVYAHEWTITDGIEGHVRDDDILGTLQWDHHVHSACSFVRGYSVIVSDEWKPDRYTHAFIPSETDPDRYDREDWNNAVSVSVSVRMWYDDLMKNAGVLDASRLEASFVFRHTTQNTNVSGKGFDQNYFLAALKFNF